MAEAPGFVVVAPARNLAAIRRLGTSEFRPRFSAHLLRRRAFLLGPAMIVSGTHSAQIGIIASFSVIDEGLEGMIKLGLWLRLQRFQRCSSEIGSETASGSVAPRGSSA
jgi:hypothetical protein